jgi:hypothetical protein
MRDPKQLLPKTQEELEDKEDERFFLGAMQPYMTAEGKIDLDKLIANSVPLELPDDLDDEDEDDEA